MIKINQASYNSIDGTIQVGERHLTCFTSKLPSFKLNTQIARPKVSYTKFGLQYPGYIDAKTDMLLLFNLKNKES